MKGVTKVDMDYPKGVFTLTVKEGVSITPTQIRSAVPARFKVPRVEFDGVSGTIHVKDGKKLFRPTKQRVSFLLENAKGKKILERLEDGQKLRVAGEMKQSRSTDTRSKEKKNPVLRLLVSEVIKEKMQKR